MTSVCLAILNYNGVCHLEYLLPTAIQAVAEYAHRCPIIVLDNQSTHDDCNWIRQRFPQVEVISAPRNDCLFSYNWLLRQRDEEIVVLLNNDLRLANGFLNPLIRHFAMSDVFSVGATSRDWEDTRFTCGPSQLRSHHGHYHWDWQRSEQTIAHTLFTSGGFMAVNREKFLQLDGFNRLFYPAYAEDLDLCFRAWRRGWRCIFEPASMVYHRENGTFAGSARDRLELSVLLFHWASLPPAAGWLERVASHALIAWRQMLSGDFRGAVRTPLAWIHWLRVRTRYRWMRVSQSELDSIQRRIRAPFKSCR